MIGVGRQPVEVAVAVGDALQKVGGKDRAFGVEGGENVWVSAFINPSGPPARLVRAWTDGRYDVVVSLPLLDELADVLTRPPWPASIRLPLATSKSSCSCSFDANPQHIRRRLRLDAPAQYNRV